MLCCYERSRSNVALSHEAEGVHADDPASALLGLRLQEALDVFKIVHWSFKKWK